MKVLLYDGSFEGLMTAIFEVYEYRFTDVEIRKSADQMQSVLFAEQHVVQTDSGKAERVVSKIHQILGKQGVSTLMKVHFSEHENLERLVFAAVNLALKNPDRNVLSNFADPDMMMISQLAKSVGREVHRMHAFIRFEKLSDDMYFAQVEPDFNVLPIVWKHFKKRYADQRWMIFDVKRNFGVYYDLKDAEFFEPESEQIQKLKNASEHHHEEEKFYQNLWKRYFVKTGIEARKNLKLHIQWMPKRYWKYLTEKQ